MKQRGLYRSVCICVGAAILALNGCASSSFREEYRKMSDLGRSRYGIENQSDTLPTLNDDSPVADFVKYAALNNRGLKASFYRWKASLEKVPQVTALDDPMFTYTNFIEEVETRVGSQENAFAVSQKFQFFGKLATRGDIAMQVAYASFQKLEAEALQVAYEVKEAYYEYYFLVQAIRLTEENKELLANFEKIAISRFQNKLATQQDVLRAQVEFGKIANDLHTQKDLEPALVATLNAVLNRPENAPLPRPHDLPALKKAFVHNDLVAWAMAHNPALKELDHSIQKAQKAKALARLNYYPDLTVGANYTDTSSALMPGTRDSGKDPIALKFSVNLPIWRKKLKAGVREAQAEEKRATHLRSQFKYTLRANLKMIAYRLRDARRQAQLYRDSLIPKARQTMQVAKADYKGGKGDFLSLVDSQRVLLSFQLTYHRALSRYHQRLAELETLVGAPLNGTP